MADFIDKIRIRLVMLSISAIVIILVELLHLFDYKFLSPWRILLELLVIGLAYATPILLTEFNQHVLPWNDLYSKVRLMSYAVLTPFIALLGLIFIVSAIINKNDNLYLGLYLFNISGFFLYFFSHQGEHFDDYQSVLDDIDEYKREHHQL